MKGIAFHTLFFAIIAIAILLLALSWWVPTSIDIKEQVKGILSFFETREKIDMSRGYKAIHVVLVPKTTPEIYEFHFTDQFNHITYKYKGVLVTTFLRFNLKPWEDATSKYCVLYISRQGKVTRTMVEPAKIDAPTYVYYVPTGTLITSSSNNLMPYVLELAECKEYDTCDEAKMGYNTFCYTSEIDHYDNCIRNEDILSQQFVSNPTDLCYKNEKIEGACPEVEGSVDCCHLLKTTSLGTHEYKVKYPLLCGFAEGESTDKTTKQAKWYACSEKLKGETIYTATGDELRCNGNDWEVVKGDLSIQAARLEYNYPWALDYQTKLEFWVTNFRTSDLNNVNITVDVMDTNFCGESGIAGWWCSYGPGRDKNHSSVSISSLPKKSIYKFEEDDFCYKSVIPGQGATDFEVNISWSSGSKTESKTFCIRFKPKSCSEGSYAFPWEYEITEGKCS